MSWWLDHPPCDLAVFKPSERGAPGKSEGLARFHRILVLALPGPYDSLVLHVADRLAKRSAGKLTLFLPVPIEEPDATLHAHQEYHQQLIRMCRAPAESLVLRTADAVSAIEELSTEHDLMVMGAPPESALRNLVIGSPDLELIERTRCAVLRLKTPRHKVHTRFTPQVHSPRLDEDMEPFLRHAALAPRLRVANKRELFAQVARSLAAVEDTDLEPAILDAFWERENQQITSLGSGAALSGFTLPGVEAPTVGVFTMATPVEFDLPRREPVDLLVVILACPADRQTQLWLKDLFARMLLEGWMLEQLREARNIATMLETLRAAFRRHSPAQAPPPPHLDPVDLEAPMTEDLPRKPVED